jgi:mycofactocin precursor
VEGLAAYVEVARYITWGVMTNLAPVETQPEVADLEVDDTAVADDEQFVEEDLLVEEISIDGMCGVY